MKAYERKLKIEIITFIMMISYFFMIRKDSSLLEASVLLAIFASWTIFSLLYHIWDLRSRGITLKEYEHTLRKKYESKLGFTSDVYRIAKWFILLATIFMIGFDLIVLAFAILLKYRIVQIVYMFFFTTTLVIALFEVMIFTVVAVGRIIDRAK